MQSPLGGSDRDPEHGRDLGDRAFLEVVQGEDRALIDGQPADRPLQGVALGDGVDRRV